MCEKTAKWRRVARIHTKVTVRETQVRCESIEINWPIDGERENIYISHTGENNRRTHLSLQDGLLTLQLIVEIFLLDELHLQLLRLNETQTLSRQIQPDQNKTSLFLFFIYLITMKKTRLIKIHKITNIYIYIYIIKMSYINKYYTSVLVKLVEFFSQIQLFLF